MQGIMKIEYLGPWTLWILSLNHDFQGSWTSGTWILRILGNIEPLGTLENSKVGTLTI